MRVPAGRTHGLCATMAALAIALSGCGDSGGRSEAAGLQETVQGEVTYREFIPVPEGAVVIVRVSRTGGDPWTGDPLGEQRIDDPGNPPIDFSVPFDPADVDEDVTYVLVAEIREGGSPFFTTDEPVPVITKDNPTDDLKLVLVRATGPAVAE